MWWVLTGNVQNFKGVDCLLECMCLDPHLPMVLSPVKACDSLHKLWAALVSVLELTQHQSRARLYSTKKVQLVMNINEKKFWQFICCSAKLVRNIQAQVLLKSSLTDASLIRLTQILCTSKKKENFIPSPIWFTKTVVNLAFAILITFFYTGGDTDSFFYD